MLCYEFPPLGGGASRGVDGLSGELASQGYRVDVVTMGFRGLPKYEVIRGVRVHRTYCIRTRIHHCTMVEAASHIMSVLGPVWHLVRTNYYNLIHWHFILPDGFLAWSTHRATGLPYIITAHGSDIPGYDPHD